MSRLSAAVLCLMVLATAACERAAKTSARETAALKSTLESVEAPAWVGTADSDQALWLQTQKFYGLRQNQPAWIVAGEPTANVETLTAILAAAADQGLNPREYGLDQIADGAETLKADRKNAAAAMDLELHLSHELLRYASHVALGHPIAGDIDRNWTVVPRQIDIAAIVQKAVAGKELAGLTQKLEPTHPEYARLKDMLQRYRKIATENKLQPILPEALVEAGWAGASLAAVRNNLLILGDLQETPRTDDNVFDEDLSQAQADFEQRNAAQPEKTPNARKSAIVDGYDRHLGDAVRRFEARHGLDPDGVPDPAMIMAMNVSAQDRVAQLALNLERWRWMPADFGTPHIFVNIASYRMQVRDTDDTVSLKMRVIAGKPSNRTPIFSDTMTTVVFSPYWNIPESIEVKEMWPSVIKDSDYLRKKQIEVVRIVDGKSVVADPSSIDWANAEDEGDFQLRQKPGASNALGFVKFIFPNRHNVYLHDTPTDNLFDKLTRDFSHGCVRLEEPMKLAAYLLRDQHEWTAERIDSAMHSGTEKHVALKNPIAVHLVYLTARVDEDGVPQFFDDAYGYDIRQEQLSRPAHLRATAENLNWEYDV